MGEGPGQYEWKLIRRELGRCQVEPSRATSRRYTVAQRSCYAAFCLLASRSRALLRVRLVGGYMTL